MQPMHSSAREYPLPLHPESHPTAGLRQYGATAFFGTILLQLFFLAIFISIIKRGVTGRLTEKASVCELVCFGGSVGLVFILGVFCSDGRRREGEVETVRDGKDDEDAEEMS